MSFVIYIFAIQTENWLGHKQTKNYKKTKGLLLHRIGWLDILKYLICELFIIGPAVLSSDMTSAYVLYFPAATTTAPPPIFPNHTNNQIIETVITLSVLKLAVRNFAWWYICIIPTDHTMQYYTIKYQIIPNTKCQIFQTAINQSFVKLGVWNFAW